MLRFSESVKKYDVSTQRRLYSLFTRAVRRGELLALKVIDRMSVTGIGGQTRQVGDFVIAPSGEEAFRSWLSLQAEPRASVKQGYTAEQVASMPDDELFAL